MSCDYCGKTNSNDGHGSCMFCGGPLKERGYVIHKRDVGGYAADCSGYMFATCAVSASVSAVWQGYEDER